MSGEFLGTYTNSVNKGKWITIPSSFKKKFSPEARNLVVVTIGPGSTLAVFPLDNWQDKINNLKNSSENDIQLMVSLRHFASEQKMETNGRIKIDDDLLTLINFDDKVVLKGEGNFISIWKPEDFEKFRQEKIQEHRRLFDSLDYQK